MNDEIYQGHFFFSSMQEFFLCFIFSCFDCVWLWQGFFWKKASQNVVIYV